MQKTTTSGIICYTKLSNWPKWAVAVARDCNKVDYWMSPIGRVSPIEFTQAPAVGVYITDLPMPVTVVMARPKEDPAAKYWDAENGMFRKADKVYLTAFNQDGLFEGLRQKLGAYRLKLESTGASVALFPITDKLKEDTWRSCGITPIAGYQSPCYGHIILTENFIREMLSSGKWLLK